MVRVDRVYGVLRKIWRARYVKRLHWRMLWLANATFMCGITGVVRAEDGRVLLLRHRFWPDGRQWGFPTGYARKGERHEDTIAREVREETGLTVEVGRLLKVNSGYRLRIEVVYEAVLRGGLASLELDPKEILEARLFDPEELPEGVQPAHREFVRL
ncbi:NUDIX domain-containing protein [Actinocorallia aurea]